MATKLERTTEAYLDTLGQVANPEVWPKFLTTACHNFRLTFDKQILLFAQKPDAIAVLPIEGENGWNKRFGRWVNRGSTGIAVLDSDRTGKAVLKYYFDISDTHEGRNARPVPIWRVIPEYEQAVVETLENNFGDLDHKESLAAALISAAHNAVEDNIADYLAQLRTEKQDSFLEYLDDESLDALVKPLLQNSIAYMLLVRCGIDPAEHFPQDAFSYVGGFNTLPTLNTLGAATSAISQMCLSEIAKTVLALQRVQEPRTFAENHETEYANNANRNQQDERSTDHGTDHLHDAGRLPAAESSAPRPPESSPWEVRISAQPPSEGEPESDLHESADQRQAESLPGGSGPSGQRDDGGLGEEDGQGTGRDGEDEGRESDAVGGPDEQHPGSSRGSSSDGTDLRINVADPDLPPLTDETLITAVFENRNDDLDVKKESIYAFFLDNPDLQRRADYLRSVYQDRFTELIVDGIRIGYYPQDNGLLIWEGAFLTRTKESVFSWLEVADRTGMVIDQGNYYKPKQLDDGQISFMTPGYMPPVADPDSQMTFFAQPQVSQQVIDEALCIGFNDKKARHIICAYFMKDKPLADNAAFLKEKYGTNGAGFYVGEQAYALWYDPDGIRIASGNTVEKRLVTRVSWEQAAKRIRELLDLGRYMPQYEIDEVQDYELNQIAEQMLHIAGDFTQEAKDAGYLPRTREVWNMKGGYPEMTKEMNTLLRDPEVLQTFVDEWGVFLNAHNSNKDLLRFRFYRVGQIYNRLVDLQREPVVFTAESTYYPHRKYFISDDEITRFLRGSKRNENYRLNVYSFFARNKDSKDREKFLRDYHGTSGGVGGNDNYDYSSKGLSFSHGSVTMPYAKVEMKWPQVAKRVTELIQQNKWLYDVDREAMPAYELKELAKAIHHFFFDTPDGVPKPYGENLVSEYWEGIDAVFEQLDDPVRVEEIYRDMMLPLWKSAMPEDRHYNYKKVGIAAMESYRAGTYSVFGLPHTLAPLPAIPQQEVADPLDEVDVAYIRDKVADFQVVDGEVIVDEEKLNNDPFIQQVEADAAALSELQYAVGDHFTLHDGDTVSDLVISSVDSRTVFYRIPSEHSNRFYDMERSQFDQAIRDGKLTDQRQETVMEKAQRLIDSFCIEEYDGPADYDDLRNVGIGFTTITDDEIPIQNNINFEDFSLDRYIEGVIVERRQYDSLEALIEQELEDLSFDDLISFTEDQLAKVVIKPADIRYLYEVGDIVYLDDTAFRITEVRDTEVQLLDPTLLYPVYRVENREQFEQMLKQDERNQQYREIPVTAPPIAPPSALLPKDKTGLTVLHPEVPADQRHNFRITDDDLGVGTPSQRYANNVAAIQLLKQLEAENRLATPEEQEVLSRYVGWGGLSHWFDDRHPKYQELKDLLTQEEYAAARESSLTAFYTPPVVIRAMYTALERMQFVQGNILEPSCGVGNFLGMLPDSLRSSQFYGVELDSISGRIAQQLYQNASIAVQGFEKTELPDSFFDVAIGNVPFGQFKVPDKQYDKHNFLIHDYFFARTLDKVRPGGIVAFITAKGTMDKENPAIRKYIAQRADLIGAIRLPNDTFKRAAGTEVTSDIIFLQKRDRMVDIEPDWVHLNVDENGHKMNQYFVDHPDMILGEMKEVSGPFGAELACVPYEDQPLEDLLVDAVQNLHAQITEYDLEEELDGDEDKSIPAIPEVRNFSYAIVEGKLYYRENSRMKPVESSATAENRIKGMIAIRDSVRQLIEYQTEDFPEHFIAKEQARLNELYNTFSKKYGLINSRANTTAFGSDSSYCLLASLEVLDDEGNFVRKADMFSKRTIRQKVIVSSVDTASEALALSLGEKARIDMDYMQELTGKTEQQLYEDLHGVIFLDPVPSFGSPKYLPADEYLSGNVRKKLAVAKQAADQNPAYAVNVQALEAVQPKDLPASDISVRLGATWLPADVVESFMYELFGTPRYAQWRMKVRYMPLTGEWNISEKNCDRANVKAANTYGTNRINGYKIIEETLNLKDVRIFDYDIDASGKRIPVLNKKETAIAQGKQEMIKQAFQDWVWKDPRRRERLCKIYNEKFNSVRPREYDGSHLNFVGMNPEIHLRTHQVNAIAHILYGGNTLLAHVVGAGKTFEMVAAAMESKRLGLCQKSLFVVPNHLTEQWASDFLRLYPSANILVATKKDFEAKNRKKFCARIATGDYDAIIIGHSQFEKIPMSVARQKAILQNQVNEVMTGIAQAKRDRAEKFTIKQMERTRKQLEAKMQKLNDQTRKDDLVTFEELGVDRIFVDEAHYYKNLAAFSKMRNVGGISQTEAQKSSDLYMKCRYLDEITGGRGVVFATGTPISNSMVEMYTMQKYLQYDVLDENDLLHFDAWASNFGETITAIELAPEGSGYRAKTRFSRFYNLPELMAMFKEVADIQTADQLKLPVPLPIPHNVVLKPSEQQKKMVETLSERAERVRNRMVDSSKDNMLLITNDGRKLALDQRLMNPMLGDSETSKVGACADNVYRIWKEHEDTLSTQMVFCDLSTPHNDGNFNVYDDLRDKLVAKGIPEEQIAYIHNANTETQKKEMFGKVCSGQIRVLIGSTQKMGAGTNVQKRLIALHHLDCPWRPSDLQQREGRIVRQGNMHDKVHIYTYVTENTFDSYLYQLVESKQKFIGQIMTSKSPVRSAEDIDETALSYAEIKALCTGNPYIKEKMDLDIEVQKLRLMKANHLSQKYSLEDQIIKEFPQEIRTWQQRIDGLEVDIQRVKDKTVPNADGFSPMVVEGFTHTAKKAAGSAIIAACENMTNPDPIPLGEYRGFAMILHFDAISREFKITLQGELSYPVALGTDIFGNIQRLDNALDSLYDRLGNCRSQLENVQQQLEAAKVEVEKPFPKEDELKEKTARLDELNILLNLDKKENEIVDGDRADEDAHEHTAPDRER